MTLLGTEDTHALFLDHARNRIGSFLPRDIAAIDWSRELNNYTQAGMTLTASDALCNDLEPWLHQLAIFRGEEPVWRGFVLVTAARHRTLQVTARDPSFVFTKRRARTTRRWAAIDVSRIAQEVIAEALAEWDPFGLVQGMEVLEQNIVIDYEVKQDQVYIADVLKDLVEAGLQWTVTGGRLAIGPAPRRHITAGLSDQDMDEAPQIVKDGTEAAADWIVNGKGATANYVNSAGGALPYLQAIEKSDGLTTDWQCHNEAQRLAQARAIAPRRLEMPGSARLLPTAPVSLTELVPGCLVPMQTDQTGIRVAARMQLSEVSVKAGRGGDEVSVTLTDAPQDLAIQDQLSPTRTSAEDLRRQ